MNEGIVFTIGFGPGIMFFTIGFGAGLIAASIIAVLRSVHQKKKRLLIQTPTSEAVILEPRKQITIGGKGCDFELSELQKPVALASLLWSGGSRQKLVLAVLNGTARIKRRQVHQSGVYRLGEEIIFRYEHLTYFLQFILASEQKHNQK